MVLNGKKFSAMNRNWKRFKERTLTTLDLIHKKSVENGTHLLSEEAIQAEIDAVRKEKRNAGG